MSINLGVGLGREMKAYEFQNGEQVIKNVKKCYSRTRQAEE